jgi:unsaturated chondroitin disaccharide hydrolase
MDIYNWTDTVIIKIQKKMSWVSEKNKDKIPYTTREDGSYDDRSDATVHTSLHDGINWWTNGFWPGIMWLLYQDTKDNKYLEIARLAEEKLEQCFDIFYGLHHDVGFMFQPSAVTDYRLTGNKTSKKAALRAANLLAGRFNPKGRFIRAWNNWGEEDTSGWAIIDCMFNLSLLYWASKETKDPRFTQIAMMHADTVMENFIRQDGSVSHIVDFNPQTGEKVKTMRGQGYKEDSSWSRGQGWALYGFVNSYLHTGKIVYLETAKRVADYCIANIPESGIIPVDFRQPKEPAREDSCGACIIAGGFIELAKIVQGDEKETYLNTAVKLLKTIDEKRADWGTACDAIVQNCSASYHDATHHMTMVYADYFFIEAIYKLKGGGISVW